MEVQTYEILMYVYSLVCSEEARGELRQETVERKMSIR